MRYSPLRPETPELRPRALIIGWFCRSVSLSAPKLPGFFAVLKPDLHPDLQTETQSLTTVTRTGARLNSSTATQDAHPNSRTDPAPYLPPVSSSSLPFLPPPFGFFLLPNVSSPRLVPFSPFLLLPPMNETSLSRRGSPTRRLFFCPDHESRRPRRTKTGRWPVSPTPKRGRFSRPR